MLYEAGGEYNTSDVSLGVEDVFFGDIDQKKIFGKVMDIHAVYV